LPYDFIFFIFLICDTEVPLSVLLLITYHHLSTIRVFTNTRSGHKIMNIDIDYIGTSTLLIYLRYLQ